MISLTKLDITAVLLVGGMGKRLQSVLASIPKPLASIGGESFLHLLVRQLQHQGIRRIIMCSGHCAEQIESEFGDGRALDVEIAYSRETAPLGTAGAVKLAQSFLRGTSDFLVMNGDSIVEIDLSELLVHHRRKPGVATIAAWRAPDAARYGTLEVRQDGRVAAFLEKTGRAEPGLINAGVYIFDSTIFRHIPDGPASLEKDVFPSLLESGIYALQQHGFFIDIGTPQDYARAQELRQQLNAAAIRFHSRGA